jgi:hypothetical protein
MKTVSQAFLDAQAANLITYYYEIKMFRRYWDSVTQSYLYEETGTDIKPYFFNMSNINWQLDTEALNVWRVSNVQLELKNDYGQFNEGSGQFFNSTYQRFKTKIEIKIGYILPDETNEIVYAFTGLIVDDVLNNQESQTVTIPLSGKEILTALTSAEDVSIAVTGETLGTGALIKEFYTMNQNVLSVQKVYINGVEQTLTTHYSVSNLYQTRYGALITFVTAPALTDIITCDYTWGNNQIAVGEQIGTGSLNATFQTDNKGVGVIDAVYIDGEELSSIDYTVNDLNDKDNFAKINFPVGVGAGQVVTCDYHHWHKNIAIETMLGYLLDAAGFPSTDRTIGSIDVGAFLKYEIWDNKGNWDGMTLSRNCDTGTNIGSLMMKNENLVTDIASNVRVSVSGTFPEQSASMGAFDYANKYECNEAPEAATPAWTSDDDPIIGWDIHSVDGIAEIVSRRTNGSWWDSIMFYIDCNIGRSFKARLKLKTDTATNNGGYAKIVFSVTSAGPGTEGVTISYENGKWWLYLSIFEAGIDLGITDKEWADFHTVEYVYNAEEGKVLLLWDGVVLSSGTNHAVMYSTCIQIAIMNPDDHVYLYLDYLYWDTATSNQSSIISSALDLGTTSPSRNGLGTLLKSCTIPTDGSKITFKAQTSGTPDFASDNDAWRDVVWVGDVGTISSSTVMKRYIRWTAIWYRKELVSPVLNYLSFPAHAVTDVIDCGTNLDVYNAFSIFKQDFDGAIKVYSQTSADGSTWDAEAEVIAGVIASTKRRYIRFRDVMYFTAIGDSPKVQKQYFTYKITSLLIAMADFSGMTVQSAIEEFAKLLDYEIGVDADGKYFFRAKNVSTDVDMQLSDSTNILSIDNDNGGWERIFNKIRVSIGKFNSLMSPDTQGEAVPHSITKYGTRELSIDTSGIEVDDNLDLSSGLVEVYYDRYHLPKRQIRLKCKMLPQLELSDTVNVNWLALSWYWFWGDSRAYWGKPDIFYIGNEMLPISNLLSNIVGLELDLNAWELYIVIREI